VSYRPKDVRRSDRVVGQVSNINHYVKDVRLFRTSPLSLARTFVNLDGVLIRARCTLEVR
jgi:hypothetical protein